MNRVGYGLPYLLLIIILVVGLPPKSHAVMVSTTMGNTTAPEDDFGFANVGVKSGSTGVYLGYRWVLTAAHVSAADIYLNGRLYDFEEGTDIRLTNPTGYGLSELTDLRLFRITEDPWLPTIKIAESFMNVWDEVVMIGNGDNRANTSLVSWDITSQYPDDENWTWTETGGQGDLQGYYMGTGRTLRWGTNQVEPGLYAFDLSETNQIVGFTTDFDLYGGTEFECQAAKGDSGGGVFHKNGDQWELAGLLHSVSEYPEQPSQAIYGLETYCSDLSFYRDIIMDIITPLPGDANLDNVVDAKDAAVMAAHWGRSDGVLWGNGDFNEDGVINELDAAIMSEGWNAGVVASQGEAGSEPAVPEPSIFILVVAATISLTWLRARR